MCSKFDRNHFTPLVTAVVNYKAHKDSTVKVVKEILSYLCAMSTDCAKCISAIKQSYRGLPLIEYDIKSGDGVIIQVSGILIVF